MKYADGVNYRPIPGEPLQGSSGPHAPRTPTENPEVEARRLELIDRLAGKVMGEVQELIDALRRSDALLSKAEQERDDALMAAQGYDAYLVADLRKRLEDAEQERVKLAEQLVASARLLAEAEQRSGERRDVGLVLWRCAKGHWTSNPVPQPGRGNGPSGEYPDQPGHCPYPCLADILSWDVYEPVALRSDGEAE